MQIINPTPSAVYNGVIQGTYRMATTEGILSLWRGMSSVIVGAGTLVVICDRAAADIARFQVRLTLSTSRPMRQSST